MSVRLSENSPSRALERFVAREFEQRAKPSQSDITAILTFAISTTKSLQPEQKRFEAVQRGDGASVASAGDVFDCDWRLDVLPKEPNKAARPAIVVEDSDLFPPNFPNLVVVPCTTRLDFAIPSLSVRIEPDSSNGFDAVSYAVAHQITVVSKQRLRKPRGTVAADILVAIRAAIAEAVGITLR